MNIQMILEFEADYFSYESQLSDSESETETYVNEPLSQSDTDADVIDPGAEGESNVYECENE